MQCIFKLPNGKEVATKEFLFKDVRIFFHEMSLRSRAEILEKFIITPDLNVVEKLITLIMLRARCIKQSVSLNLNNKDKEVGLDYILESFDEVIDIREEKQIDNILLTLDYPSRFVVNTDNIFSVIQKIKIDDEEINLTTLTEKEFIEITNSLPAEVLGVISNYIEDKQHALQVTLFPGPDSVVLNFLNESPFNLIESLYNCIDPYSYREYLFVLSRRMKDVTFLLNSTLIDIEDYMSLYKRENDDEGDSVAKIDNK
tara:strand:+ start:4391 stop:5161 length:771 start_codon:yes stop_codon:yes gene_type:complete